MARPSITPPKNTDVLIDKDGKPTEVMRRFLELVAYRLTALEQGAFDYTELDTGTATTAQIAAALNTFMDTATET
jgi:hypothetical protein